MSETRTPDGLLLRRYREGDEAAFDELRRRHGRLILATCRRETGDAALAEDAAQGVFLLLTRKTFDDHALLGGWLHEASRLVCRNLVRSEGRRRRRERRAFEEFQEPEKAWNAVSPHVDAALASLRPGDREAVLLRFAGEMSLGEVGQTLGMGENAARMRVSRALDRMRDHLRRAGVGVGVVLLASLLSTRIADAQAMPPFPTPSARAVRAGERVLRASRGFGLAKGIALGLALLGGTFLAVRAFGPPARLGSMKTKLLFSRSVGSWRGTLEYADDATGARTRTPTQVEVDRTDGGLRLVARYPGFATADTTTFRPDGTGRYRIDNVGSHRLDGLYELVRLRDGPAFVGFSPAVGGEVRLRFTASPTALTIAEEYRRGDAFRFRNRFDLVRSP